MTNTMTPSEIAEWLDIEANTLGHVPMLAGDAPYLRQAAATIRELEAKNAGMVEALSNSQAGGLECREQLAVAWAKLNIATEALTTVSGMIPHSLSTLSEVQSVATQALARIKEVG